MRSLVTGGAGFIGSHLVDALLDGGDEVLVLDDLSSGRESNLRAAFERGARLERGGVEDGALVARLVAEFGPECVYHLAAQIDVRRSLADPAFDATINVLGTIELLEAVRAGAPNARFVLASTGGAIYGEGSGRPLPLDEREPARPDAAYGTSKLAAELYLDLYRRLHGLATVALRFGNVYGPRQDPHGEAGVVAIFSERLREGRELRVFGDGLQTRDYVYVADVVEALLAAAAALARRGDELGGPFNVGTGVESSVLQLVALLEAASGQEAVIEHHPERLGEVQRISIDPGAAAAALGWRPQMELAEGLRRTYEALAEEG